jgi:hypothetical protein
MKKEWRKPLLLVLVRGTPEESILTACKWDPISGPNGNDAGCLEGVTQACVSCAIIAES